MTLTIRSKFKAFGWLRKLPVYGKHSLRLPRPLFEDPNASESDGDDDDDEDEEDEEVGSMRDLEGTLPREEREGRERTRRSREGAKEEKRTDPPAVRSYEYFKAVSARKVDKGPSSRRCNRKKRSHSPTAINTTSQSMEPEEWYKAQTNNNENTDRDKPSKSLDIELETVSNQSGTRSSASSLPAISPICTRQSPSSSRSSEAKVDQSNQTDLGEPLLPGTRYGGKNQTVPKSRKERKEQLKLPSLGGEKSQSQQSISSLVPPKPIVYTSRGDTSRTQRSKSTSLRQLTAAFRENVSKGGVLGASDTDNKEDLEWLKRMSQAIDVIDHDSYDLFARRRKLAKQYIPRNVPPKHERMDALEVADMYNDDCEEDIGGEIMEGDVTGVAKNKDSNFDNATFKNKNNSNMSDDQHTTENGDNNQQHTTNNPFESADFGYDELVEDSANIQNSVERNEIRDEQNHEHQQRKDSRTSTSTILPSLAMEREHCLVSIDISRCTSVASKTAPNESTNQSTPSFYVT